MGDGNKSIFVDKTTRRRRAKIILYIFLILILILFGIGLIGVIADGGISSSSNNSSNKAQPEKLSMLGQKVSDARFDFIVNSIRCGETRVSTDGLVNYYSDAQGQYCRLNITVTNTGNDANSIRASNQIVFNAQGQKYDYDGGATAAAAGYYSGSPLNDDINPGNSITGDVVFDVPAGVTPTVAELHGSSSSKGVKISLE